MLMEELTHLGQIRLSLFRECNLQLVTVSDLEFKTGVFKALLREVGMIRRLYPLLLLVKLDVMLLLLACPNGFVTVLQQEADLNISCWQQTSSTELIVAGSGGLMVSYRLKY